MRLYLIISLKNDYVDSGEYNFAITSGTVPYIYNTTLSSDTVEFSTDKVDDANAILFSTYAPKIDTTFIASENNNKNITGYKGMDKQEGDKVYIRFKAITTSTWDPGLYIGLHTSAVGETITDEYKNLVPNYYMRVGNEDLGYIVVPKKPTFLHIL